jgi:Calx-beta domain
LVRVSLDVPSAHKVTVDFNTVNGTAVAASDYQAVSGKLSFARGETSKSILVPVIGDRLAEPNETFVVKLSGAKGAAIAHSQGVVTILDDEPRISIYGMSASEGNANTTLFAFTVSLSTAYHQAVTVDYASADGTATTADHDYVASSGTLVFAPGETTKTLSIAVIGDTTPEMDETFSVNLGAASTNALVISGHGIGTIVDDDLPTQPGDPGDQCTPDNPYYPNC